MKRLTSHGIASFGPEETKKVSTLLAQAGTPATPIKRTEGERQKQSDRAGHPHISRKGSETRHGEGADAFGHYKPLLADHTVVEALGRFANLIATAQISGRLCEAMETQKPGGGEVRNQRQTPTVTNWHNTQTTRGSHTGSTRQGKPVNRTPSHIACTDTHTLFRTVHMMLHARAWLKMFELCLK